MDRAHSLRCRCDVADRREGCLVGNFARQQNDGVVTGCVDVHAFAVTSTHGVGDLELDRLVVRLHAHGAAIRRDQRGAADPRRDNHRNASIQERRYKEHRGQSVRGYLVTHRRRAALRRSRRTGSE